MDNIRMDNIENQEELPALEVVCMSFSTLCFFACGAVGISHRMPATSLIMIAFSILCGVRVLYLLSSYYHK